MNKRSIAAVTIAIAAIAGALTPAGAGTKPLYPAPGHAPCAAPSYERGLGWTCPGPDGLKYVVFPGGGGGLTHGHDPVPGHGSGADFKSTSRAPACVKNTDSEFHILTLYVHPSDQGTRYAQYVSKIRKMITQMTGLVYNDAREFKRSRTFRFACTGKQPKVIEVKLDSINDRQDYATVLSELRRKGYTSPLTKYLVYYDGRPPNAPGGTALMGSDETATPMNQNNYGPYFAVSWGIEEAMGGAGVLLHELGHTLGAVQRSAPDSNQVGHCNDGADIMCYPEPAPGSNYNPNVCREAHFDCGHDTYFHPNPKAKSWLGTHWNIGSTQNRFMAGCSYRTGVLTPDPEAVAATAPTVAFAQTGKLAIPKGCSNRAFTLSATMPVLPPEVYETLAVPYPVCTATGCFGWFGPEHRLLEGRAENRPDANVCFFKGSKRLKCYSQDGFDTGKVPKGANRAQVTLGKAVPGLWVLSVD